MRIFVDFDGALPRLYFAPDDGRKCVRTPPIGITELKGAIDQLRYAADRLELHRSSARARSNP